MQDQPAQVVVTLPDGSELAFDGPVTVEEVAHEVGPGLGEDCVAGLVRPAAGTGDADLVAPEHRIADDAAVEVVTPGSDAYRQVVRHSAAHVLAQAVLRLYPDARLAVGPPTDDGFYYDFDGVDVDEDDLDRLAAEMRAVVEADYPIEREAVSPAVARERLADQPYKQELLDDLAAAGEPVTLYRQGEFVDLCAGPHVASTGEIPAFALREIAAAYWRGEESNPQLTRVYGTAFESEAALAAFEERRREAERRDHRRVGRRLDLFSVPEHSPGCVQFHPDGMRIRRELESLVRAYNDRLGYEEVWTPALNRTDLWRTSGHYEQFTADGEMFVWEQDGTEYGLKPMNCANHVHLYRRERRSYRELPVRYSEFGTVYRNEQSGELSGLLRVRGFTQDDGHAFVRRDQIAGEVGDVLAAIREILEAFDMAVTFKLETRPADAFGDDALWAEAESALREALDAADLEYEVAHGEGAFYGPKVGADAADAIGREWTVGTVQLDFVQPERFGLVYVDEHNEERRPVMIHRALLGAFERFLGVITEHFAGDFPPWLAPEQVRVLPVSEAHREYAGAVAADLDGFRVSVRLGDDTLGRRVRRSHDDRVPYVLVVGDDEVEAGTVSVRDRQERRAGGVDPGAFREHLRREVEERRVEPGFLA